jgi:hypothetical protein
MADGEDWVMRPAIEQVCRYESLVDGTLSLFDVVRMNEALDVRDENSYRIAQIPPTQR